MMSKQFLFILPFVTLLLILPFASSQPDYTDRSKYVQIQNIWDREIQDLASYAVSEYDRNQTGDSHLYLVELVGGAVYNNEVSKLRYTKTWLLWLKATICSHPGPPQMFEAQVVQTFSYEIIPPGIGHAPQSWKEFKYLVVLEA